MLSIDDVNRLESENIKNKKELRFQRKMVELLMSDAMTDDDFTCEYDRKCFYDDYKNKALRSLELEDGN